MRRSARRSQLPGPGRAYGECLARYSPFSLLLDLFILAAIAFYRVRVHALLPGISASLAAGDGYGGYLAAALPTDALAAALVLTLLAGLWLLMPLLRAPVVLVSAFLVFCHSSFMVLAADFLRIYQTSFTRGYVGSEHFTGIGSILISARAEMSSLSQGAVAALATLLAAAAIFALRMRKRGFSRGAYAVKRLLCVGALLSLAACLLSGPLWRTGEAATAARVQGMEAGRNPLSAVVFAPKRGTFSPPRGVRAVPAFYNTDSLEKPGALRPRLPVVRRGRHNIILYFCESTSWRYYDLSVNGREVLPVMHRLARNGILLKNHYTAYPLSAHTLYTVLSSRYPPYGKSSIFGELHDADVHTLPEILAENGYATCLIHTGDLLYGARNRFLANRSIGKLILYKDLVKDERYTKKVGWGADERSMIGPAVDWAKAQTSPFLLMLVPVNPHHPYAVPEGFPRLIDTTEAGISEREKTWRSYLNSLHYADAAMGEAVDALERSGLMKDTLFVMVADHGEAFYQHPKNYNHPLFIYEENVHVPALFYGRSLFRGGLELESVTRHLDIMPSILDAIGVKDAHRRDGESIFSVSREKMAVVHTSWNDEYMGVRDGRWKYVQRMKDSREELYDLEADPSEMNNIAGDHPPVTSRYRAVCLDMAASLLEQYRSVPRKR
jgi:arylsulfatase A-like enzyme